MDRFKRTRAARVAAVLALWLATGCSNEPPVTEGPPVVAMPPVGAGGSIPGTVAGNMGSAGGAAGAIANPGMGAAGATVGMPPIGAGGAAGGTMVMPPVMPPMSGGGMGGSMVGAGGMPPNTTPPPAGDWGAADPAMKGTFATVTENNVGPGMAFTMFRPMELTKKHPVVTWGNGTGTTPPTYRGMLTHFASHGFVVIASNSMNVAQGTPPPMVAGVTWVFEQNDNMMSPLYQHIDTDHVGATGHSQGAFAASSAAADPKISVWAPLQGARSVSGQHGPGLLICGGMDTTVPCSGASSAFDRISTMPVMYAELKAASHTNWIAGGAMHPYTVAATGWFRLHLMGDTSLKPMFYGPMCKLCTDTAWVIKQKMLD